MRLFSSLLVVHVHVVCSFALIDQMGKIGRKFKSGTGDSKVSASRIIESRNPKGRGGGKAAKTVSPPAAADPTPVAILPQTSNKRKTPPSHGANPPPVVILPPTGSIKPTASKRVSPHAKASNTSVSKRQGELRINRAKVDFSLMEKRPLDFQAFATKKGLPRKPEAARKALARAKQAIIDAINAAGNDSQKALALHAALIHPECAHIAKSAGFSPK